MDDSLTNLQWLQNFSILSAHPQRHSSSDDAHDFSSNSLLRDSQSPSSPPAGDTAASGVPRNALNNHITSSASANMRSRRYLQQATERLCRNSVIRSPEEIDYKANYRVKPPYSYATLIFMAMQASNKTKITLSAIYSWITENFPYYRHAEPSWQNSIRHNLSLNKCFMKVARTKDEPGKGGFWQIDPQYADMFADGVFKRKRTAALPHAAPRRRNGKTTPKQGQRHRYPSQKRVAGSPLLTTQAIEREVFFDGISHWTSGFVDIATSSWSRDNFEDMDVNMALSGLDREPDASLEGHPLGVDGRMYIGSRTMGAGLAFGYMEVSDSVGEHFSLQPAGTQPYPPFHPPQYKELVPFYPQQAHNWEESREELQPVSLAADHSFSCSEGFFTEAPWEGSWSLACDL